MNTTLVGGHFRGEAAMEIIHSLTIGEHIANLTFAAVYQAREIARVAREDKRQLAVQPHHHVGIVSDLENRIVVLDRQTRVVGGKHCAVFGGARRRLPGYKQAGKARQDTD